MPMYLQCLRKFYLCDNQICLKESISCEDYNPSTIDSCDKKRGCLHTYCYSTSSHQYFNPELENSYSHYSFSFYGRKRSIGRTTQNGKEENSGIEINKKAKRNYSACSEECLASLGIKNQNKNLKTLKN